MEPEKVFVICFLRQSKCSDERFFMRKQNKTRRDGSWKKQGRKGRKTVINFYWYFVDTRKAWKEPRKKASRARCLSMRLINSFVSKGFDLNSENSSYCFRSRVKCFESAGSSPHQHALTENGTRNERHLPFTTHKHISNKLPHHWTLTFSFNRSPFFILFFLRVAKHKGNQWGKCVFLCWMKTFFFLYRHRRRTFRNLFRFRSVCGCQYVYQKEP